MAAEKTTITFGWRIYGLGVMALGMTCLVFGEFDPSQPVPDNFPARAVLAYAAGAFLVAAAAAIEWRRTVTWGAAALTAYYALFVLVLMDGPLLPANYAHYGIYESIAEQLAVTAAGLIVFVAGSRVNRKIEVVSAVIAARITRVSQMAFGLCAVVWGGAHFVYMNLTAPLVPKWLPPTQEFWGYATGACFIAAGIAIVTGIQGRLAAILLTVMIACFGVLVNGRVLLADTSIHFNWTESALNLALTGASWVVADSLAIGPVPELSRR